MMYFDSSLKLDGGGAGVLFISRDNNVGADVLSKLGSTRAAVPPGVFVHELHHPSVKVQSQQVTDMVALATVREVLMIEEDWRIQFIDFIKEFKLPCNTQFIKGHKPSNHIRAMIKSHIYIQQNEQYITAHIM